MLADAATALLGGTDDVVAGISNSLDRAGRGELRLGDQLRTSAERR